MGQCGLAKVTVVNREARLTRTALRVRGEPGTLSGVACRLGLRGLRKHRREGPAGARLPCAQSSPLPTRGALG